MAESSFAKAVEEELRCPICLDYFIEPKILPKCGHVACEECLKRLLSSSTEESHSDKCPECRKAIGVRKEAVRNLKTNLRLRNLADRRRDDVAAINGQSDNFAVVFCSLHCDEKMHLYCVVCNTPACQLCLLQCHIGKEHNIVGIAERCKDQKLEIKIVLEEQRTKVYESKDTEAKIKEQMKLVHDSLKNEEESIAEFTKKRIDEIQEQDLVLRAKLKEAFSPKMEQLQRQLAKTEEEIGTAERIYESIQQSMAALPDFKYVSQHDRFVDQLKSVRLHQCSVIPTGLPIAKFVCKRSGNRDTGKVVDLGRSEWKAKANLILTFVIQKLFLVFVSVLHVSRTIMDRVGIVCNFILSVFRMAFFNSITRCILLLKNIPAGVRAVITLCLQFCRVIFLEILDAFQSAFKFIVFMLPFIFVFLSFITLLAHYLDLPCHDSPTQ